MSFTHLTNMLVNVQANSAWQQCHKKELKKKNENFSNSTSIVGSLPLIVRQSVSFYCYLFSLLFFFKYLFIFHLLILLKFGLWLFIQLSLRTFCICLVMFVWLFHVGRYCSPAVDIIFVDTHDQFPLGRAHPLQVVFRWWFMLLTGSFWSPLVTCKDWPTDDDAERRNVLPKSSSVIKKASSSVLLCLNHNHEGYIEKVVWISHM